VAPITSPWSSTFELPEEYRLSQFVADRLPPLNRWTTEVLFFLFYTAVGDKMQMMAANMLHEKGWRYNMATGLWVARFPNQPPEHRTDLFEKGVYQCFDVGKWENETVAMVLHYNQLANPCHGIPLTSKVIGEFLYNDGMATEARLARRRREESLRTAHLHQTAAASAGTPNYYHRAATAVLGNGY